MLFIGLIAYREWIYHALRFDQKALEKKYAGIINHCTVERFHMFNNSIIFFVFLKEYMTPQQIQWWVSNHTVSIN
jgi:hypothetical protein